MNPKAVAMARAALEAIDEARIKMRDARNEMAEAEAKINLEMARLHAFMAAFDV